MKIRLGFKTPDVLDYALEDISEDEKYAIKAVLEKWVKYGECITVEVDTVEGTCTVIPV